MNFQLSSEMKSRCKGQFVWDQFRWGRLTNWNAAEVLHSPSFDIDKLMARIGDKDVEIRAKAQREWMHIISRAVILGLGDYQFMQGEESTNFPKIKAPKYTTISLSDLTWYIMDHRNKVKAWKEAKDKAKAAAVVSRVAAAEPEVVIENNDLSELVIENDDVPDDWDASDDEN